MTNDVTISPCVGVAKDQRCRGLLLRCEARGMLGGADRRPFDWVARDLMARFFAGLTPLRTQ